MQSPRLSGRSAASWAKSRRSSAAPVSFSHTDAGYEVDAPGFAHLNVNYRTDNRCCVMPGLVWYTVPLSPIDHRMVASPNPPAIAAA